MAVKKANKAVQDMKIRKGSFAKQLGIPQDKNITSEKLTASKKKIKSKSATWRDE